MPLYFHSNSGRTASSKMKKLGVKMRPEMLLHTKQTRPELHAASPLNAELPILYCTVLRAEKSTGSCFVKTGVPHPAKEDAPDPRRLVAQEGAQSVERAA